MLTYWIGARGIATSVAETCTGSRRKKNSEKQPRRAGVYHLVCRNTLTQIRRIPGMERLMTPGRTILWRSSPHIQLYEKFMCIVLKGMQYFMCFLYLCVHVHPRMFS